LDTDTLIEEMCPDPEQEIYGTVQINNGFKIEKIETKTN
jgi:hypothetical protein